VWGRGGTLSSGAAQRGLRVESFETLLYEEDDGVAIVTLNRPEVHNAQVSSFVSLGTQFDNVARGQETFHAEARPKWRLR